MTNFSREQILSTIASDPALDTSYELATRIADAADTRKGEDILLLKVGEVTVLADYFVLVTGFSKVQIRAIAGFIEAEVEEKLHRKPLRSEGLAEGGWVVQDYGDVIVHILMPQEREHYDLEAFWGHAPRVAYAPIAAN
ncbi:MAG: ribosome silencing factor [Leptolyngbyaceae cyanobacterium CSU_1_3]|nr:ribosome silencing factor [Leptolyngbyaceae cyanobacterium CSU_1_3]